MNVDEEVLRFSRLLESVVRVSKVSVRELERRLDLGGGSLNRIFSGRIDLKVRHILLVMDALGIDPRNYFKEAYKDRPPDEPPGSLPDHLMEALAIFAPAGRRPERAVVSISDEEFDRRVDEAFRRYGIEAPKPPRPPRKPGGKGKGKPRGRRPKAPKSPEKG